MRSTIGSRAFFRTNELNEAINVRSNFCRRYLIIETRKSSRAAFARTSLYFSFFSLPLSPLPPFVFCPRLTIVKFIVEQRRLRPFLISTGDEFFTAEELAFTLITSFGS